MSSDPDRTAELLRRAAQGEAEAWGALLERYGGRLRRMVALRLDRRLYGRIDPSDVVQEAFLDATARRDGYLRDPAMPPFLWLRFLTAQKLLELHRRHLGVHARDAGREVALAQGPMPEVTSAALAARLVGGEPMPSQAAILAEVRLRLQRALDGLDPLDREVLALRHFEQLSNAEAAQVLGIAESAASKRHLRALERLRAVLRAMPGGLEEFAL